MSKLMGKNILKVENCGDSVARGGLLVRYLKVVNAFEFRGFRVQLEKAEEELVRDCGMTLKEVGEKKNKLVVAADVVEAMMLADKVEAVYAKWSYGYKTVEKLGAYPGEMELLKRNEYKWINSYCGGEGVSGIDLPEDDYFDLCVWQYVFKISPSFLNEVKKQWKRRSWGRTEEAWVPAETRCKSCGRKKGALGKGRSGSDAMFEESLADFMARVEHNQKIAVEKGFLGWYLDMEKEKARRFGTKFGKEERAKAVEEWNRKRNEKGNEAS